MLDILASLYYLNATALQDDSFQVVLFILLLLFFAFFERYSAGLEAGVVPETDTWFWVFAKK